MNNNLMVSRRGFLQGSSLIFGSIFTPKIFAKGNDDKVLKSLISEFSNHKGIVEMGYIYLKDNKYDFSRTTYDALFQQVETSIKLNENKAILESLNEEFSRDFENERICILSDWWLSETEAKLCALAALS